MNKYRLPIAGMAMILAPVWILNKDSAFPGWWALLPTVGAFLVLSAGTAAWLNRNFLGNRAFVWIGLISYPLYLWHWPALYLFRQLFLQQYLTHTQWVLGRVCTIGVAILLSWLTYRLVELPIRSGSPGINVTYSLAGAMAIVVLAGGLVYTTDGFASRLSPQLAGILGFDYAHNSSIGYRMNTCLLDAYQDQKQFGNFTSYPPGKAMSDVLLWGDSHAAELFPGFQTAIGASSKLTQLTSSLCPPIIGYATKAQPHCREINDYVMEWIARDKPDRVVLAGLWTDYDWKQLADTVRRLKLLGVERIDLVGPVPIWQHSLPTQLFLYARNNKSQSTIPDRMSYGLDPRVAILNASMREFAKEIGINYYSPYMIFLTPTAV